MGAALGSLRDRVIGIAVSRSLRDRVSRILGIVRENELRDREGSVDDFDPEWGAFFTPNNDQILADINGPVEVYQAVPYPSPESATIRYGVPTTEVAVKNDYPKSRQRFLNIVCSFPHLCTYLSLDQFSPAERKSLELMLARTDKHPTVQVRPIPSEPYQHILVHAPPYHSVAFRVSNVPIFSLVRKWDNHTKKYTVQVFFAGPRDRVTKYMVQM